MGDGLGLGFVVFVGDGLGLELCDPLFDGDGLGELPDGDGEPDPDVLGLAELLDEGLALLSDFLADGVVLGERVSATLAIVSSAAPTVLPAAVVAAFAAFVAFALLAE